MARFGGGFVLFTKQDCSIGMELKANANGWSTLSDSTRKENFRPVDGEDLLIKLRHFRLDTWNYKGQDPASYHPPISLDRLSYDGPNGTVDYRPKSSGHPLFADDAPRQDPLDLLAALTGHIPNKGQQLVRYFGWYSNKSRGLRHKALMAAASPAAQNISVTLDNSLHGSAQDSLDTPSLPIAKLAGAHGLSSSKKSIWYPHWFVPSAVPG